MLLIVFHHYAFHGGIDYSTFSVNNTFLTIIESGGKIGVNIFILITGYFSCQSKFSIRRIVKILIATEFYSIILMIVSILVHAQVISRSKLLLTGFFPLLFGGGYWFVSFYIILFVLSPILNIAVERLSKKTLTFIILFLLSIYCILPNTIGVLKSLNDYGLSTVIWFIMMYLIGAYFREYSFKLFDYQKLSIVLLACSMLIMFSSRVFILYKGESGMLSKIVRILADDSLYSIMPFVISVLFFIVFSCIHIRANRILFSLAKATFGVYLIHDNVLFKDFLWNSILKEQMMYQSDWFIIYSIGSVLLLYIVCSVIEILREKLLDSWLMHTDFMNKLITKVDRRIV